MLEILEGMIMSRNGLYGLLVVLLVAVVALSVAYKNEADKSSGINIEADEDGISIETKE